MRARAPRLRNARNAGRRGAAQGLVWPAPRTTLTVQPLRLELAVRAEDDPREAALLRGVVRLLGLDDARWRRAARLQAWTSLIQARAPSHPPPAHACVPSTARFMCTSRALVLVRTCDSCARMARVACACCGGAGAWGARQPARVVGPL